jgi:hypothetical protein
MPPETPASESVRYRWTVLVMLTLVYTFNFIDRQILVILQEPIKAELGLSDAQRALALLSFTSPQGSPSLGSPIEPIAAISLPPPLHSGA